MGGRLPGNKAMSPFTVTFHWSACPHRAARSIDSESFHRSDLTSVPAQMLVQESQVTHRVTCDSVSHLIQKAGV